MMRLRLSVGIWGGSPFGAAMGEPSAGSLPGPHGRVAAEIARLDNDSEQVDGVAGAGRRGVDGGAVRSGRGERDALQSDVTGRCPGGRTGGGLVASVARGGAGAGAVGGRVVEGSPGAVED